MGDETTKENEHLRNVIRLGDIIRELEQERDALKAELDRLRGVAMSYRSEADQLRVMAAEDVSKLRTALRRLVKRLKPPYKRLDGPMYEQEMREIDALLQGK